MPITSRIASADLVESKSATVHGQDRDPYLDLLRALAVSSVVIYHLIQMSPVSLPGVARLTKLGCYGVDLFFVLSGWLIGGLYWKERLRFGNVDLKRFWLRRWLRTIPPYLAALLLSWGAVYVERKEAFNWGYLCFLQNYSKEIPFFLVSWSLCIEEHFYLFVPLLLVFAGRSRLYVPLLFSVVIVISPACRSLLSFAGKGGIDGQFGFTVTATHLRMEGLILGFWAAQAACHYDNVWKKLKQLSRRSAVPLAIVTLAVFVASPTWMYRIGFTLLAFTLIAVLILSTGRSAEGWVLSAPVKQVALASYSIYLTHALMLHVARRVLFCIPALPWWGYFPVAILAVFIMGFCFYFAIEKSSISLRDRWVPRRTKPIPS